MEVGVPGATDTGGARAGEEAHDADVVWGEVPDDVDVLAHLPKVEAPGIQVHDVAEGAGLDLLARPPQGVIMKEGMARHEREAGRVGTPGEVEALVSGGSERLLDEDVLAVIEGLAGEGVVCLGGGSDHDGVDAWVGEEGGAGIVQGDRRVARTDSCEACGVRVGHGGEWRTGEFGEVADEVRTPVACADDADARGRGTGILHVVVRETVGAVGA